jgi:hypothetical protein
VYRWRDCVDCTLFGKKEGVEALGVVCRTKDRGRHYL